MRTRWIGMTLIVAVALFLALGTLPALRAYWWGRESNPIRRGAALAARVGCLSCHGPDGTTGLPDPNTGEEVPTWDGGMPMMYVNGPDEVREYVLDGVSKRRAGSASASALRERSAIKMPAYRDLLEPQEVDDLVAYFMTASDMIPIPDEAASRGRHLVRQHRCESCHGLAGSGGVLNPGSFKGYVPGWLGHDFEELVRDDGELRDWILEGDIPRLSNDRSAQFFLARQRLKMPPYKEALSSEDTEAIAAYIGWLRENVR